MKRFLFTTVLLAIAAITRVGAHDFWLAARHESNTITITGNIGETFPISDGKTTPDRVDVWRVIGPGGDLDMGRDFFQDGESLATRIELASSGTYLAAMTILPRSIEMTGKAFMAYLREEGLDQVVAERLRLDHAELPARERYARYAKIVVRTGASNATHVTRPLGMKAEFIPSVNPATVAPGGSLPLRFLVEGQPVEGALITVMSRDRRLDARTDANGQVTFAIPSRAAWLVKTVHMARPVEAGAPPVDWESYWVTLAFEN
jgi:hypothetical protein